MLPWQRPIAGCTIIRFSTCALYVVFYSRYHASRMLSPAGHNMRDAWYTTRSVWMALQLGCLNYIYAVCGRFVHCSGNKFFIRNKSSKKYEDSEPLFKGFLIFQVIDKGTDARQNSDWNSLNVKTPVLAQTLRSWVCTWTLKHRLYVDSEELICTRPTKPALRTWKLRTLRGVV